MKKVSVKRKTPFENLNLEKTFSFKRQQEAIFSKSVRDCSTVIGDVPKGKTVLTGGGSVGIITGKQSKNAVQIIIVEGEMKGEYDWISKEASVQEVKGGVPS